MCLWKWFAAYVTVLASSVKSLYISSWVPVQAQGASPVNITHPLGQIPAKVEVQVKVQESGNDVIFPASGSAQRDDDSYNVYGGVVYFYNEFHVKIFVPVQDENTDKGVAIYTGNFVGPFVANYAAVNVRVKVWDGCDLPLANFTSAGTTTISTGDSYKSFTHGLGRYPDLVVVQLKMNNGYVSEAGGVTFNSVQETHQSLCGAVFAYNDQEIRLWSASGTYNVYVACAKDGWGSEEPQETSATVHIQAWVLCTKQFTKTHMLNMNSATAVDTVPFDAVYSLDTTLVSVQMKVLESNNEGFIFYAGGSAMIDTSSDPFGALIYAYTESEVFLWRPDSSVSHGYLVYLGGQWGGANQGQQSTFVEVTVRVIELADIHTAHWDKILMQKLAYASA
uniref:Uncharacterized protein LOC111116274 n=1 Tax=Crassostrea virginica TaxID=6565 RepID=A0A8B8C5U2_CRAVI|nr:uncharacterized protein LOC111116274 [Crassostrea virginica]